jgi:hypothetical protein
MAQPSEHTSSPHHGTPCALRACESPSDCDDCPIEGSLRCRFHGKDIVSFLANLAPFVVASVAGMLAAGYGWGLLAWVGYSLFFFVVWETRILCCHCPYWAQPGLVLHCHAKYGLPKIWKYRPGPLSRLERVQFVAGTLVVVGTPLAFLVMGGEYLWALIAVAAAFSALVGLRTYICSRCVHLSCPLNTVPEDVADRYTS